MPLFSAFLFFFIISNVAFPGTSNFIGELLLFFGLITKIKIMFFIPFLGAFLCLAYTILFFNRIIFGTLKVYHNIKFMDLTFLEAFALVIFIICNIILGLVPNIFISFISIDIITLLSEFELKLYMQDLYSMVNMQQNLGVLVSFLRQYFFIN